MRILVVFAHPKSDSFNAAVCAALCEGLSAAGHEIDLADLNAERFNPVLQGPELDELGAGPALEDVIFYQQRILKAEAMAFVCPVWWFGLPAILKGFIDRVFQEGFAFQFTEDGKVHGLLRHKKALVVCTAGASARLYRLFRFGGPLEKTFGAWTLKMCGIPAVRHVFLHDVPNVDNEKRGRYLKKVRRLGFRYF